jgi:hypothetical protein
VDHDPKFPLHEGPDAHPYALLGRYSGLNYFLVGAGRARAPYLGGAQRRLLLRINDDMPGNGDGRFSCRVRIWRWDSSAGSIRPLGGLTKIRSKGCGMDANDEGLRNQNIRIGEAEAAGDRKFFETLLAPAFAFMRSNGEIVDRQQFLKGINKSSPRLTQIESVTVFTSNRALVTCVVTVDGKTFHNVRLFTRYPEYDWQLLAWANEEIDLRTA